MDAITTKLSGDSSINRVTSTLRHPKVKLASRPSMIKLICRSPGLNIIPTPTRSRICILVLPFPKRLYSSLSPLADRCHPPKCHGIRQLSPHPTILLQHLLSLRIPTFPTSGIKRRTNREIVLILPIPHHKEIEAASSSPHLLPQRSQTSSFEKGGIRTFLDRRLHTIPQRPLHLPPFQTKQKSTLCSRGKRSRVTFRDESSREQTHRHLRPIILNLSGPLLLCLRHPLLPQNVLRRKYRPRRRLRRPGQISGFRMLGTLSPVYNATLRSWLVRRRFSRISSWLLHHYPGTTIGGSNGLNNVREICRIATMPAAWTETTKTRVMTITNWTRTGRIVKEAPGASAALAGRVRRVGAGRSIVRGVSRPCQRQLRRRSSAP